MLFEVVRVLLIVMAVVAVVVGALHDETPHDEILSGSKSGTNSHGQVVRLYHSQL